MFTNKMIICTKCKKEKPEELFIKNNKQLKQCFECRETSKKWKDENKETISLYNKNYNEKKLDNKEVSYVYARKIKSDDEWLKFDSQLQASKELKLQPSNINKVLKGELKKTGGYEFKIEIEIYKSKNTEWTKIKEENNITEKCKGQPSNHRILHQEIDGIMGKKCCTCKLWKPLVEYNKDESHWDKLRVDCKKCLVKYRKENIDVISKNYVIYERKRKQTDPEFKLLKTLRSRIGNALKVRNIEKNNTTLDLTGCSIAFLKGYLEAKFKEDMTWENHGEWHIDHIKPCASFNLLDEDEQNKCFHYTNLQPLWKIENLVKGSKYDENDNYENEFKLIMEYFCKII
jgi:hypothetical protein